MDKELYQLHSKKLDKQVKLDLVYLRNNSEISNFHCPKDSGVTYEDYLNDGSSVIYHIVKGRCVNLENMIVLNENDYVTINSKTGCVSLYMLDDTDFLIYSKDSNFYTKLINRTEQLNNILAIIKRRDEKVFEHCLRVSRLANKLAISLGINGKSLYNIIFAGRFHEIGDTKELKELDDKDIEDIINEHHDYLNNKISEISIEVQILSVVNLFDILNNGQGFDIDGSIKIISDRFKRNIDNNVIKKLKEVSSKSYQEVVIGKITQNKNE